MSGNAWKWYGASTTGNDHKSAALPCQDAHVVQTVGTDGIIAIVSDGAGSASQSDRGAHLLCEVLTGWLFDCLDREAPTLGNVEMAKVRHWVEQGIDKARAELVAMARSEGRTLSDYRATLVGAIADRTGGALFHVGDGAALAASAADLTACTISPAENGEYANETYFFTDDAWREHLRFASFGQACNVVVLMSDGVTPTALAPGGLAPFAPFLEPIGKFLGACERDVGHEALKELLDREAMQRVSGDDKTLVWMTRLDDD